MREGANNVAHKQNSARAPDTLRTTPLRFACR